MTQTQTERTVGEFPILVEIFDLDTMERLWKATVKEPGLIETPTFQEAHRCRIQLTYSVGRPEQRTTVIDDHTESAERETA